jgi:hypothetical protein
LELKADVGIVKRGSVLSLVANKLELTTGTNQSSVYGVLLDASVDTALKYSTNEVTGSIARQGSFRGPALTVGTGVNATTLAADLRTRGIFIEGPVTVPGAAATTEEAPPAPTEAEEAPPAQPVAAH